MAEACIEHVNITVSDPQRAAKLMKELFGWDVRWQGPARDGGTAVHVGSSTSYIALYAAPGAGADYSFEQGKPLNHIGVQVEDLALVEAKVVEAGFTPKYQGTYEPGPSHFYFCDYDNTEYEVLSYSPPLDLTPLSGGGSKSLSTIASFWNVA